MAGRGIGGGVVARGWSDDSPRTATATSTPRRRAPISISADCISFERTLQPGWAHASLLGQNKRMPVITRLTIELIIVP